MTCGVLARQNKQYQKLTHTFSRISVGIKFAKIGLAGKAGRLKETEFNYCTLILLLNITTSLTP